MIDVPKAISTKPDENGKRVATVGFDAYSWVGVSTKDFDGTIRFFTEAVGLSLVARKDNSQHALFRLSSGQDFEVFGSRSRWYPLQIHPVLGFETMNLQIVRRGLEAQGVEFASDVVEASGWGKFCYFRGPGGYLYELVQRCPAEYTPIAQSVLGYSWVGLRTAYYNETVHFLEKVIALPLDMHDNFSETTVFQLSSGQLLEILGLKVAKPECRYMQDLCVGFEVKNVETVGKDMASVGVNFITEIDQAPKGARRYFLGPDDRLYAIQQQGYQV